MPKPSRLLTCLALATSLAGAAAAAPAAAEVRATSAALGPSQVPGEVVVRYAAGATRQERAAAERAAGVGAADQFAPRSRLLKIRDGGSVAETVRELRAQPGVASAAPNQIARIS